MSREIRRCLPSGSEAGGRIERVERRAHQQGLECDGRQDDVLLGSAPMAFDRKCSVSTDSSEVLVRFDDADTGCQTRYEGGSCSRRVPDGRKGSGLYSEDGIKRRP